MFPTIKGLVVNPPGTVAALLDCNAALLVAHDGDCGIMCMAVAALLHRRYTINGVRAAWISSRATLRFHVASAIMNADLDFFFP
jgi:hypothetical protein